METEIFYSESTEPLYNNLYTDYRLEVIAANLKKYYTDVEQIFIQRLGNNGRPFNKDIKSIKSQYYDLGEKVLFIETYREGIYDSLPEALFHPPSIGGINSNIEDVVHQIRKQKKVEESARKFFRPFEFESFYLELSAVALENDFDIAGDSKDLMNTISELWPLLNELEEDSARVFIYFLPFFQAVRGNKKWFEKCMSAFLQIPVEVSFVANEINDLNSVSKDIVLSKIQLGISTILTGAHMDGERNWAIKFGPHPYKDLKKYIPSSSLRNLLQMLYSYCLPATVKVEEHFITTRNDNSFILAETENTNRLGFSTFI